jgi:hypothetical protein
MKVEEGLQECSGCPSFSRDFFRPISSLTAPKSPTSNLMSHPLSRKPHGRSNHERTLKSPALKPEGLPEL